MTATNNAIPRDRYFASVSSAELPAVLRAKAEKFREKLDNTGRTAVWQRSERTYYGFDGDGGLANSVAVTFSGESGENVTARINHYRSIIQSIIAMVTNQRPAFKARARNADAKSLAATGLAEGVVDYVYRKRGLEGMRIEQVERALVSGEGYLHLRWDTHRGRKLERPGTRPVYERGQPVMEDVEVDDGEGGAFFEQRPKTEEYDVREGDIAPEVLGPLGVVRDLDERDPSWMSVPHRESAWVLAARYPQFAEHILGLRGQDRWPQRIWCDSTYEKPETDDDAVTVWCFYHKPTDALPKGRYALVAGDVVLADDEWKFGDEIPVYGLLPMREMGSGQGHSPLWDLLCLQELYDACVTSMWNATEGAGEGNVTAPKGSDFDATMLARGRQLIEFDVVDGDIAGSRPMALELFKVPTDAYKIEELIKRTMEVLSGINAVVRGEPPSSVKSGAALAFVGSLSSQFNSSVQSGVTRNDESAGSGVLALYKRFSPQPRIAEIVGKTGNRTAIREFTSADLEGVESVTVEIGNPAMRGQGLIEIALELLKAGAIKAPDEFFELLTAGRIEPLFDPVRDEMRLIRRENEELAAGRQVKVNDGDNDVNHIRGHARVADDPDVRNTPGLLQAQAQHIAEHLGKPPGVDQMTMQPTPGTGINGKPLELMWALGQEIPPWRQAEAAALGLVQVPANGPPGGPANEAPPGDGGPSLGPPKAERAQPLNGPSSPAMPLMPKNPATGERAPADGSPQ